MLTFVTALLLAVLTHGQLQVERVVTGADAWGPGVQLIGMNGGCSQYFIRFTIGGKFWSLELMNPTVCPMSTPYNPGCPFGCGAAPAWPLAPIVPFVITFHDITTSASFMLPTRHNAPYTLQAGDTIGYIPDVLDSQLPTANMRITLKFQETPISTIVNAGTRNMCSGSWSDQFSFSTNTDLLNRDWGHHRATGSYVTDNFADGFAQTSFYYGRWNGGSSSGGDPRQRWWFWRKGPIPPYVLSYQAFSNRSMGITRGWRQLPEFGSRADHYCNGGWSWSCSCSQSYTMTFTYYETVRYYKATAKVTHTMLRALMPNEGDTWETSVNDTDYDVKFRFGWYNVARATATATTAERERYFAVFVLQPFPLQDIWITVTDDANGFILFQDTEAHFPYVEPRLQGQLGWLRAIDYNYRWGATAPSNVRFTVTVKFNRRQRIMNELPNEERAVMIQDWTHDQGSDVLGLKVPIPPSVLLQKDLMGAVAARPFTNGEFVMDIDMQCVLTGARADAWLNTTFPRFQSNLTYRKRFHPNWPFPDGANYTHDRVQFILGLMATLNAEEQKGRTWFTYYASFYPTKPTDLPTFWDAAALERMLGFSELVRFVKERLQLWRDEYDMIGIVLPWFKNQHTLERWMYARAYIIRNGYNWGNSPGGYLQLPLVNIFRRRSQNNLVFSVGRSPTTAPIDEVGTLTHYRLHATADIALNEEVSLDFNATKYTKHEYLINFGGIPAASKDATTVPGVDQYLENTAASRQKVVEELQAKHNESYKSALNRLINLLSLKQGMLPLVVDGLGSPPEIVDMATVILNTEKAVGAAQLAAAIMEYSMLP